MAEKDWVSVTSLRKVSGNFRASPGGNSPKEGRPLIGWGRSDGLLVGAIEPLKAA